MLRSKSGSYSRWLVRAAASSLLLLAGILFNSSNCLAIDQTFKQTYPLPPGGSFLLDNVNGSVQVDGWDRDEVEVSAVKTSQTDQHEVELVKIEVDSTPGKIAVHTRYPEGEGAEVAVEYHVHVPYRILLGSVETVNGSVTVRGADLKVLSMNGDVTSDLPVTSAAGAPGSRAYQAKMGIGGGQISVRTINGGVRLFLQRPGV
jgi:hypothetical protein